MAYREHHTNWGTGLCLHGRFSHIKYHPKISTGTEFRLNPCLARFPRIVSTAIKFRQ